MVGQDGHRNPLPLCRKYARTVSPDPHTSQLGKHVQSQEPQFPNQWDVTIENVYKETRT